MAASAFIFAIQDAQGFLQSSLDLRIIKYLRPSISTLLTLPLLSSNYPQLRLIMLLLSFAISTFALNRLFHDSEEPVFDVYGSSTSDIRVLSKFVIPTSSIWPERYLSIARSAERIKRKRLHLELETILRDLQQGRVELRNSTSHLPLLIKGQLQIDGWKFELGISLKDKLLTWRWAVSEELSFYPKEEFPRPFTFAEKGNISPVERMVLQSYCSLFYENHNDITIWPSLDTVPRAFMQKVIRATQHTLKMKLKKQSTSVVSFTTAEEGLCILDDAFVLAALPFSRPYSKEQRTTTQHSRLSSSPLFTHLPEILSLLTSGLNALRVLSMSNASASYANALDTHAMSLEYDSYMRRECIKVVGVQGWREERLYARWEAALLRSGMLTRWVVLLDTKE